MKPSFSILLIFASLFINSFSYELFDSVKRPLLSFIVNDVNLNYTCLESCLDPLKKSLIDFVNKDLSLSSVNNTCRSFNQTKSCVMENCDEPSITALRKLTAGFRWLCGQSEPFKYVQSCIVEQGRPRRTTDQCSKVCNATIDNKDLITNVSLLSPNASFIQRNQNLCNVTVCYLRCTVAQVNRYCPTGGSRLAQIILSGFEELNEELLRTTPREREYILSQVPPLCLPFFDEKALYLIRYDVHFLEDMFYMITSRRQRTKTNAATEADRIIMELMRKMEGTMQPKYMPEWDTKAIVTCTAILLIMIVNMIALIFTVCWCLTTTKEDNGELGQYRGSMNHFVEPNIRMKLKVSKRNGGGGSGAAVRDSSHKDFFEMRVPRNGNNFNLYEDQTVIVPKHKRRRTYSMPLEPRPRTQSDASDRVPQIVIIGKNRNSNNSS